MFKIRRTTKPAYLNRVITARVCGRTLRSSTVWTIPQDFFFRMSFPLLCTYTTWNSLPNIVTAADSLASFKSRLKTHLFNQTFRPARS